MTQKQLLLKALKNWISPLDALRQAGSMKLATRVSEYRREGYEIDSKWHCSGEYKVYRLRAAK